MHYHFIILTLTLFTVQKILVPYLVSQGIKFSHLLQNHCSLKSSIANVCVLDSEQELVILALCKTWTQCFSSNVVLHKT